MTTSDQDKDSNFSNVSWSDHIQDQQQRSNSLAEDEAPAQTKDTPVSGQPLNANPLGVETLDCTVTLPIKENDGTKDAFVSYLITTNVRSSQRSEVPKSLVPFIKMLTLSLVHVPVLRQIQYHRATPLHRLRLPLQTASSRLSRYRRTSNPR